MFEILATQNSNTAYLSVFVLMILNGVINFPSSQLLYIFLGYLSTIGNYSVLLLASFGALGNTLGNIILYETTRANKKVLPVRHMGLDDTKRAHFKVLLERHGIIYIFIGKLIPAVKVFIPVVAGLTNIKRSYVYIAFLCSSLVWAYALIRVGALFGTSVSITKWYTIIIFIIVTIAYIYTYRKYPELFSVGANRTTK